MLFLVFCDEHLGNHLLNTFRYLRIFIKIMCMESLLYTLLRLLAISRVTLQFCSTSSSTFFTVVSKYDNLLLCSMLWIFARSKKNSKLNVQTFFTFVHSFPVNFSQLMTHFNWGNLFLHLKIQIG